jgi:hypothetical protein
VTVLTAKQRKAGQSLAEREGSLRWEWGDWALDVAGPVGEDQSHTGSTNRLVEAVLELSADHNELIIPAAERLRDYRYAAAAIPPELRKAVKSVEAGRMLGQRVKDLRERDTLIKSLKNAKGIVTVDAVREHFERAPTREAPPPKQVADAKLKRVKTPEEKATEEQIRESRKAAVIAAGEGRHVSAYFWKLVGRLDEWRRDMAVMREEINDLAEDEKARVAEAARRLREECDAWLDVLEGREAPLDTIDGLAVDVAARELIA